ncbi:MAG TPA: DUF1343 domain-containing protein [Firmicutes bacterium]|nr:DUF1343 domain-containing protein [Candidatus Fermentithermobacillaceae bacterium]
MTVGLEVMLREGLFKDRSVGLLTNHTGLNRDLVSNVDLMLNAGYRIKALFSPWVDGYALASRLKELNLPGVLFRPVYFRPAFGKWSGEVAGGVAIHVVSAKEVRPVELGVQMLFALRDLYPEHFQFRPPSANGTYFFDLLAGGPDLRESLQNGDPPDKILGEWDGHARAFVERRRRYLIYD